MVHRRLILILCGSCLFLIAQLVDAQGSPTASEKSYRRAHHVLDAGIQARDHVSSQDVREPEKLSLGERVWIATQIYSAIETYFGHWRGVPNLDFDKQFRSYFDQIIASDDRLTFDLACMELIAKLKNSHSGFGDQWLRSTHGQRLGFYAYPIEGKWVVTESSIAALKRGDVIESIGNQTFENFFDAKRKYIAASDERWARRAFFEYPSRCRLRCRASFPCI